MSIVAKSLKNKDRKISVKGNLTNLKQDGLNFNLLYAGVVAFFVILAIVYTAFVFQKMNTTQSDLDFPSFQEIKSNYEKKLSMMSAKEKADPLTEMNYLLSRGELNKLYAVAQKEQNYTYLGIYHYQKGQLRLAEQLLRKVMASGTDDLKAGSYLANIYFRERNFDAALNVLKTLNQENFYVLYNTATVYESLHDYPSALSYYRNSLKFVDQPLVEYRIMVKIFVLKTVMNEGAL
jgi:tetratricopeptide (TPR) repeat protein